MITVPRPRPNPRVGVLVAQTEKRIPFPVNRGSGYSNPDVRWRWCCPVCPFTCEDREQEVCQLQANAHKCGGAWCAIPITAAMHLGVGRVALEPTSADRQEWTKRRAYNAQLARERAARAAAAERTSDRVVPFPGGDRG